jgi:FG-GAP repeat protein
MMGVIQLPSGDARNIDVGAPIATVVVGNRTLGILTTNGSRVATAADKEAKPVPGVPKILDLTRAPRRGILALYEDGSIGEIGKAAHSSTPAKGAYRLLAADDQWAAVGPRAVVASAIGRFLPGDHRQLAVVTYSGHVALLDTADGTLLADLVWPDARDLAAADLDGDGREELIVGASRFVTALSGVPR